MVSNSIFEELEKQDWADIIKSATLHAVYQLKYYGLWNRRGLKGYSAQEITMEAIEKIYLAEWKWNPEKSSLLDYLKFHVIRGLVSNLAKSSEFKSTHEIESSEFHGIADQEGADEIIASMNQDQILKILREEISSDEQVKVVFEELLIGLKRSEICEKYDWENRIYDNASRRLSGFIRKITDKIKHVEP
ncbi:hypothetical protein [Reichenbachiella sp.]|uniref:hypothetical protein n=1 Tax=Reichenbachiella sp. TaxID=2184521 RepID=UPI003299FEE7